jgi:two-component system response regulator AtoC
LIVDDEEGVRKSLVMLFQKEGHRVCPATNGEDAIRQFGREAFDLVITDLRMDGMNGIELLNYMQEQHVQIPIIIMTAFGTIDSAVEAMRLGAMDYVAKPFEYDEIVHRANRAIERSTTARDMSAMLRNQSSANEDFPLITGISQTMSEVRNQLKKISSTSFPVLITGETGTGKNLTAKAIHLSGARAREAYISVNCASIPEQLLESELFGHAKGAFTGALMERKGLFEAAHRGTILLDEIGSIPKALQAKLLGVLQDKMIRRVGSNEEIAVDARVIVAANTDLPLLPDQRASPPPAAASRSPGGYPHSCQTVPGPMPRRAEQIGADRFRAGMHGAAPCLRLSGKYPRTPESRLPRRGQLRREPRSMRISL